MNLPNFLSLIRILFIPLLVILLIYEYYDLSLIILVLSAISDALDGFIARFFHQKTTLGAYLDPIADKLLLVTSYITLSILNIIPDWLTIIVISRDVIISLGVLILLIKRISSGDKTKWYKQTYYPVSTLDPLFKFILQVPRIEAYLSSDSVCHNRDINHCIWITLPLSRDKNH